MFHTYITFIPAVLPRKRKPTSTDVLLPITSTEKQPSDNLEDYSILSPTIDEGDESIKTVDSGFEEARQFIHQKVSPKGKIMFLVVAINCDVLAKSNRATKHKIQGSK